MRMPKWLQRRRRFEGGRWESDRDACHGGDGLESAVNWMQYVLGRDFDGREVRRCIVVAEVGEGREAMTVYTMHSVDATSTEIRGLLTEGLRGLDEQITRATRRTDIEAFVNAVLPQMVEALGGREPTAEEREAVVRGLVDGHGA